MTAGGKLETYEGDEMIWKHEAAIKNLKSHIAVLQKQVDGIATAQFENKVVKE